MARINLFIAAIAVLLVINLIEAAPTDAESTTDAVHIDQDEPVTGDHFDKRNETDTEFDDEYDHDDMMIIMPVMYMRRGYDGYRGGYDRYRGGYDRHRGGYDRYRGGNRGWEGGRDGHRGGWGK